RRARLSHHRPRDEPTVMDPPRSRIAALRARWRLMFGAPPPAGIKRLIAHRIQERTFGGLDHEIRSRRSFGRWWIGSCKSRLARKNLPGPLSRCGAYLILLA